MIGAHPDDLGAVYSSHRLRDKDLGRGARDDSSS
jgi:hypothetical protein